MQHGKTLNFLKPVSLSATIGLSTRPSKTTEMTAKLISQNVEDENTSSSSSSIGCLGVCVHIDMSPITISISEAQVCLIAGILYSLVALVEVVTRKKVKEQKAAETTPPVIIKNPTQKENSTQEDSTSEQSTPLTIQDTQENENVKLTAWIQWTIARFTMKVYTNNIDMLVDPKMSYLEDPTMKLVLDAEDIVSSLDFQSVYLKIKSKISTVNIKHYERVRGASKWTLGAFRGLVMIPVDETVTPERQEDTSFLSATITRASCQHTHTLWGANRKSKLNEKV